MKFCPNCGSSVSNGSKFCSECGAKLDIDENGNTVGYASKSKPNKKIFFGIGILLLAIVLLASLGGSKKGPEKAVYNYLKSCYKGELDSAIPLLSSNALMELEECVGKGYTKKEIEEEIRVYIKEDMDYVNEDLEDMMGINWLDLVQIETIRKNKDVATVRIFLYDDYIDVITIKEKGRWKIGDIPDLW